MAKQHVRVELFYQHTESGVTKYAWHPQLDPDDAEAAAVYARNAIGISHGRGPEQGEPTPSSATLTFKGHEYNPENPASALYGLIGRNTPIRIISGDQPALTDTFTRTTSNGWTGAGALAWVHAGGTVPDDYDVSGQSGSQTHPSANVYHASHVDTGSPDHVVRATWDVAADDITGGDVWVEVRGRVTDSSNYYALVAHYSSGEQVTVRLSKFVGGSGSTLDTYSTTINLAGIATSDLIGELVVEGNRLYGKVWRRFGGVDEPIAYQVYAEDDSLSTGNLAGFGSLRFSTNTNANLQFRLDHFTAIPGTVRFSGEVSSWKPRRSMGGDRWVEVEAGDPLRRLQAPQADALRSALWRENLLNAPLAFWPLTDGVNAVAAASALPGGAALSILKDGELDLRQVNDWVEPILTPRTGEFLTYNGPVNQDDAATEWSADLVFAIDTDAQDADLGLTLMGPPSGLAGLSLVQWTLSLDAIGTDDFVTWSIIVRQSDGVTSSQTTIDTGTVAAKDGRLHHVRLTTDNNGANTDWELYFDNALTDSGTTAEPWLPVRSVRLDYGTETAGQMTAGFPVVWGTASPPANVANAAVVGRSGELVGDRLARLFGEEDIAFELVGLAADTEAAGPQLIDTLAANAAACEAVDMGLLHGTRHQVGISYRTRVSLYGQAAVTLDVDAGGEVAEPLEPDIGDLGVVNDVTVKRANGSSARSVAESGPLNVNPPSVDPDGVGRYPIDLIVNADLDSQLPNLADWRRYRGTQKMVRYPQVTVKYGALAADGKATLAAAVDHIRIGDRFDLANAEPTGVMQLVPGYTETIGPVVAERELTLNGTPANVYEVGIYNETGHKYDSAYSTTAADFDAGTDTSLSIAVEAGRSLWVTGSGSPQFPIDLSVAGCRLRVTAISGASSPQTATVNATVVNGINKTIPSGTPVRLWSPRRYGA